MEYPWEEFETEYSYLTEMVLDEEAESQDEKLWDEESLFRLETQWEPTEEEDANAVDEVVDPVLRYLGDVPENSNDPDSPISMATLLEQLEETAVERMTEAARTQEEFEVLLKEWDRLDRNRERRERYHEILKPEYCQENREKYSGRIFPASLDTAETKLLLSGKFLDLLFDCPYEMHGLLADSVLSAMVENLSDIQKETLYFLSLQFVSTAQLACMRGQSDRNIRKLRDTYTRKLQRQLYTYLKEKKTAGQSLSGREKDFFDFVRGITERKWFRSKSEKRKQISQKKMFAGRCIQRSRDWSGHMKYVVEQNLSMWIHYSKYEIRICQGIEYIIPAQDAYPRPYNMQKKKEELVLDAVNVGLLVLGKKSEQVIREAVMQFVEKYGLLGMMTALPVTPEFMEFPKTFFPKNRFIREKGILTETYMKKFFPYHDVDAVKKKLEPNWDDPDHTAFWSLLNGVSDQPDAVRMTLQKEYAEPYEWVVTQLKDWAYMLSTTYLYYADGVVTDLEMNLTLQMGMEAFGGVAPSYIILLRERPTLWWHFNSLQQCIHMMLAFMLADEKNPLQLCKYCHKAFIVTEEDSWFCKSDCKKKFENKSQ